MLLFKDNGSFASQYIVYITQWGGLQFQSGQQSHRDDEWSHECTRSVQRLVLPTSTFQLKWFVWTNQLFTSSCHWLSSSIEDVRNIHLIYPLMLLLLWQSSRGDTPLWRKQFFNFFQLWVTLWNRSQGGNKLDTSFNLLWLRSDPWTELFTLRLLWLMHSCMQKTEISPMTILQAEQLMLKSDFLIIWIFSSKPYW